MQRAAIEGRVILTHDSDFGRLAIIGREPYLGIIYLRPGHIDPLFTIGSIEALFEAYPDVTSPFIAVVRRQGERVFIRLREQPSLSGNPEPGIS